MAYGPTPSIDEFIQQELEKRMMEQEMNADLADEEANQLDPTHELPMRALRPPQRTPNNYDMDPIEPREGHIDSLRRRFGPDEMDEDMIESLIRRNTPGRRY